MPSNPPHSSSRRFPSQQDLEGLPPDGGPDWNRLVFESSPYLLQHASNPVDWFPWGAAAFERAVQEDKPIFLSIGYATCHWCHVMEHESFEDAEVAALLNRSFVCIKVDKEERPDIDDIYMTACQAMTGQGGWPLTVLLTHDRKPFFAGTYFPKRGVRGRAGMMELVPNIVAAWKNRREDILKGSEELTGHIRKASRTTPGTMLDATHLQLAFQQEQQRYDEEHGGFGDAPKFPTPHTLSFLLRYWRRSGDERALVMVEHSLLKMGRGGIFDHIGFGFHRYSTDRRWLVPHFEKMLYDQAMLAMAYVEAYQATANPALAVTARRIFSYVLDHLTSPEGGFYSAEDADSEGEEGKFYVWSRQEVLAILDPEDGDFFCDLYQIREEGNFRDEASGAATGLNIPHLGDDSAAPAGDEDRENLDRRLQRCREQLFLKREQRIHPLKDDKILTDWNGLMIAALAKGAAVLGDETYANAARRATDFVLKTLRSADGRLYKRFRRGKVGLPAHLDDYAFFVWGLLEMHQTTFEPAYLKEAVDLTQRAADLFQEPQSGAFFLTAKDGEALILRSLKVYDGAVPSGNSVMADNLARLAALTGEGHYAQRAQRIITAFAGQLGSHPAGSAHLMRALDFLLGPTREVVIAGRRGDPATEAMLGALQQDFSPHQVNHFRSDSQEALFELAPFTRTQVSQEGRATAYVCEDFSCRAPTTDLGELLSQLKPK